MFIDRKDYDHMVKQLNNDIPLLVKKIEDMRSSINKILKKRKLYDTKLQVFEWRNHKTEVLWLIYYNVTKENGKTSIQFVPVSSFYDRDGTKSYFVFCWEVFNSNSAEKHLFKVFSGHFIDRYHKWTKSIANDPYDVIMNFIISQDLTLNYNFKQNEKWRMFLDSKGIAMVQVDRLCLVFDTFVLLSNLYPDQKNAIREYIDDMLLNNPVDFFISFLVLLKPGSGWNEFITEEVIRNALKSTYENNPELAMAVVKQMVLLNQGAIN